MTTDQIYKFKFSKQSRSDCNADSPPLTLGLTHHWRRSHHNLSCPPRCLRRCVQLPLWELRWVKTWGQEDSLRSVILNMTTPQNTLSHHWYPIWFNSMFKFCQKLIQFNVWFTIVYPKFNPKYCSNQILPSKPVDWTKKSE